MLDIDMTKPGFERLVSGEAPLDRIHHGMSFGEGPLWNRRESAFYWVDIVGDTIWRWRDGSGAEVFIRPSTKANGLTFDRDGRLCVAGWASRSVWRVEPDGKVTTLASHYQGKRINSPNDIVVRSDGSIYFTDSPGALYNVGMAAEDVQQYLDFQGVFRISPDGARVAYVVSTPVLPKNEHEGALFVVPATGGAPLVLGSSVRIFNTPVPRPQLRWSPEDRKSVV